MATSGTPGTPGPPASPATTTVPTAITTPAPAGQVPSSPPTPTAPVTSTASVIGAGESAAFVVSYYASVAAGDYETSWSQLSPEFQRTRSVSFRDYVHFWDRYDLEILAIDPRPSPDPGQAVVRLTARYSSAAGIVDEVDELTLRRVDDDRLVIVAQRVVG